MNLSAFFVFLLVAVSAMIAPLISLVHAANGNYFQFALPVTNPTCFEHESGSDSSTVTLHYMVHATPNAGNLQLAVRNPTQTLSFSDKLKITGKEESVNFQTAMAGPWEICLNWNAEYSVRMELDVEGSVDLNFRDPAMKADDYTQLTDKLLPLFEKAEYEIEYLTARSLRFEKTASSNYFRIVFLTIFEICLALAAVGWQVWTLRRFFKAKKIV